MGVGSWETGGVLVLLFVLAFVLGFEGDLEGSGFALVIGVELIKSPLPVSKCAYKCR